MYDPNRFVITSGQFDVIFVYCKDCHGSSRELLTPVSVDWVTAFMEGHECV